MANILKYLVSLVVVLTFSFVYFAQTSEAAKGPKITHKVHVTPLTTILTPTTHMEAGLL